MCTTIALRGLAVIAELLYNRNRAQRSLIAGESVDTEPSQGSFQDPMFLCPMFCAIMSGTALSAVSPPLLCYYNMAIEHRKA